MVVGEELVIMFGSAALWSIMRCLLELAQNRHAFPQSARTPWLEGTTVALVWMGVGLLVSSGPRETLVTDGLGLGYGLLWAAVAWTYQHLVSLVIRADA